jgi:deoxyguanosine kinase
MLIVVEGCFAAGKTTVARGLAAYRGRDLLLENFEANPFLRSFYENPTENALETEFAFLLVHFHQLKGHLNAAQDSEIVSDFHLGKDLVYADSNLADGQAKRLFRELYELCAKRSPPPGLVIFLSATTELLIERIRSRNRDMEVGLDPRYCQKLNEAYEEFFASYSGKKLRIDMNEWNFAEDASLFQRLSSLVDRELGKA